MASPAPNTFRPRPFRLPRAVGALPLLLWLTVLALCAAPVTSLASEGARPTSDDACNDAVLLLNTVYPPYTVALGDGGRGAPPRSWPGNCSEDWTSPFASALCRGTGCCA